MEPYIDQFVMELLHEHVLSCALSLGGRSAECFNKSFDGRNIPCVRFILDPEIELLFLGSNGYPGVPPVLLITYADSPTVQMSLDWNLSIPSDQRLLSALQARFKGPSPFFLVYGPSVQMALDTDADTAHKAGWDWYFSGQPQKSDAIQKSLFARSSGLLSEHLLGRTVMVVGLGSGGSYVTECLVRSGVGNLVLVDGECVELENLCRTTYYLNDIGSTKVQAITRHLLNINPSVNITQFDVNLADIGHEKLGSVIDSVDLIVALTDDPYAQSRLNHYAYFYNKPALFASLYRGAQGGEIIICLPGQTPCLECVTGGVRSALSRPDSEINYGTGRLSGEPAIIADIHHLDSATVKLALSLLLQDKPELAVSGFVSAALAVNFSYLCMSMVPDYWVFPQVFGKTPGQYGYQSIWFTAESSENCPICGLVERRENPSHFPLSPPRNF